MNTIYKDNAREANRSADDYSPEEQAIHLNLKCFEKFDANRLPYLIV